MHRHNHKTHRLTDNNVYLDPVKYMYISTSVLENVYIQKTYEREASL